MGILGIRRYTNFLKASYTRDKLNNESGDILLINLSVDDVSSIRPLFILTLSLHHQGYPNMKTNKPMMLGAACLAIQLFTTFNNKYISRNSDTYIAKYRFTWPAIVELSRVYRYDYLKFTEHYLKF